MNNSFEIENGLLNPTNIIDEKVNNSSVMINWDSIMAISVLNKGPKKNEITLISLFWLCGVIIGGGSIGAFTNLYDNPNPILMNCWRVQSSFVFSIPFVIYIFYSESKVRNIWADFNSKTLMQMTALAALFTTSSWCFVRSTQLTLLSHTHVLGTVAGVMTIFLKLISCQSLHKYEVIGFFTTILGCCILILDRHATKGDGRQISIYGDLFALVTSSWYVVFYYINSDLIKKVNGVIVYSYMMMASAIFQTCILFIMSGWDFEIFSTSTVNGVFGCYTLEKAWISFLLIGPIWGMLGNWAYVVVSKYFESHISANFMLLQPAIGQTFGVVLGLDNIPGLFTFLGFSITGASIFAITQGSRLRVKKDQEYHK